MRKLIHDNPRFSVYELYEEGPSAQSTSSPLIYIEKAAAVVIIPILADKKLLLIKEWRPIVKAHTLELPGGRIEHGETPGEAAKRELIEETGYAAEQVHPQTVLHTNNGLTTELIHVFHAPNLTKVGAQEAGLELEPCTIDEVRTLICTGAINCAITTAALLHYMYCDPFP